MQRVGRRSRIDRIARAAAAVLLALILQPLHALELRVLSAGAVERLEIGYTWYAKSRQGTHVNASAKLLLMTHAFETLGARLVGWRTDNYNFASQRAIERLGAKKDGVLRHHALRRDGTVRDTVMYSMTAGEWPEAKAELQARLARRPA